MNHVPAPDVSSSRLEELIQVYHLQTYEAADDDLLTGTLLNNAAVLYHDLGEFVSADVFHKRALSHWERLQPRNHALLAQSLSNRAALYRDMEVYPEAERVFQLAVKNFRLAGWPSVPDLANAPEHARFHESPLWSELPDFGKGQALPRYRSIVQTLKARFENKEPAAVIQLRQTLGKLGPWSQDIELGHGISTRPAAKGYPSSQWTSLAGSVPADLSGKTVLDIGCEAGFFSLKMKERNAGRVVGIDTAPHLLAQARFLSQWFESPMELYELDAYSVDQLETRFDVIVFLGLFCHLKHPFHALEKAAAICDGTMYFQTILRGGTADFEPREDYPISEQKVFNEPHYPRMFFIEKSINGDASNWWFATRSCVKAMLRVAGFETLVETDNPEILVCSIPPRPHEASAGGKNGEADIAKVKEVWGGPITWDGHSGMVCWMQHPKVQERLNLLTSGNPHKNRFQYFEETYCKRLPVERVITLGCGHGDLERGLSPRQFTLHHDAIDISEGAISEAIRLAEAAGLSHIHYKVGDLNTIDLPAGAYDVVFAISSIHHTAKLERVFEQISRSLKPGGYFFADEFIGPTQFQWTKLQLKEINRALAAMPAEFRRCVDSRKGMKSPVMRITIEEMNRIDPSEAVRSAEILPLMSQVFDLVEVKGCGGSLLHMLLEDIAGNFSTSDPAAMAYLESLFKLEDDLIQTGALQHDFAVIIARKKASAL